MSKHSGGSGNCRSTTRSAAEQAYVSMLYGRLDELREQAAGGSRDAAAAPAAPTQARSERDSAVADVHRPGSPSSTRSRTGSASAGSTSTTASRRYIGRIGILDDDRRLRPAAARLAGPGGPAVLPRHRRPPEGVRRRRHIRTRQRKVTGLDDEVLDLDDAGRGRPRASLTGEAALLAALNAGRTGRMSDIVETIQAEQDRDHPRRPHRRAGRAGRPGHRQDRGRAAPGRVPALHAPAAAGQPRRAASSGRTRPSCATSARCCPSLGETGVLLRTRRRPVPRRQRATGPSRPRPPRSRAGPRWPRCSPPPSRDRQRVPDEPLEVALDGGTPLRARPGDRAPTARDRARRSGRPHNLARRAVRHRAARRRARRRRSAERIGRADAARRATNLLDEADLAEIRGSCATERRGAGRARRAVAGAHPAAAAGRPVRRPGPARRRPRRRCTDEERALLLRDAGRRLDAGRRAAARRGGRAARRGRPRGRGAPRPSAAPGRIEYAEGVLEIAGGSRSIDFEDEDEAGDPGRHRPDRRRPAGRAARGRRRPAPPPSGRPPTGPGRSGTSSSTRRRSCRRWPGGC